MKCYAKGWLSNQYILFDQEVESSDEGNAYLKAFSDNKRLLLDRVSSLEKVPRLRSIKWEVVEVKEKLL